MATKIRWKEKLNEAVNTIKNAANNAASSFRNVVKQPTQNTNQNNNSFQKFQQAFSQGYGNFVKNQEENINQKKQEFNYFTNQIINKAQSPEVKEAATKFIDNAVKNVSPSYKMARDTYDTVEKYTPGGWSGGIERTKNLVRDDAGRLLINRAAATIPQSSKVVLSPMIGEKGAENIGYGLKGATNLMGFDLMNKSGIAGNITKRLAKENEAKTKSQKQAEDIGQALYGTALTAPIGAGSSLLKGAVNIGSRALQGTTLGLAMATAGTLMSEGRLPTTDELIEGGTNGLENSWQLAFTNAATNKLLGLNKATSGLQEKSIEQTFKLLENSSKMGLTNEVKNQILGKGLKTLFLRSLAEVPAENTLWTFIDQLDGDAQDNFINEWVKNLPGNILGNVVFGMATGGTQGALSYNKSDIDSAISAAFKTFQKFSKDQRGMVDLNAPVGQSSNIAKNKDVKYAQKLFNSGDVNKLTELSTKFPDDVRITKLRDILSNEIPKQIEPIKNQQMVEPVDIIQKDLAEQINKTPESEPIEINNIKPEEQKISEDINNAIFGEEIIKNVDNEINKNGSVLSGLESDRNEARELRKKEWDIPTLMGQIRTQWEDKYYYLKKYDPESWLNAQLINGGGNSQINTVIKKNIGKIINTESSQGRLEDFDSLLQLDRLNELVGRGFKRNLNDSQIKQGYVELSSKYNPEELNIMRENAQKFRGFLANILQASENTGLISHEAADEIRKNNQLYVSIETLGQLQREHNSKNWLETNSGRGSNSFNSAKQDVIKKISDSDSGIGSVIESSLQWAVNAMQSVEKNAFLRNLIDRRYNDGTNLVIPLRQAENIKEKIKINSEIAEIKPVQRKLQRLIRTRTGWLKQIEKAIGELNIEGLNLSLKNDDVEINQTRLDRVLENKVLKLSKLDSELSKLNEDGLNISLQLEQNIAKPTEYFKKTGGYFESGNPQYTKVEIPPRIKSIIEQMIVKPDSELNSIKNKIENRESKSGELVNEILDIKDQLRMQKFVDSLVSLPSSEINKISKKIETKEGKAGAVMREISALSDELEQAKDELIQLRTERGEIENNTEAPEGYGTINLFRDGIKEEWAVPKELEIAIKNLDAQDSGAIIEWYSKYINQPFKQAATSLNPVFVGLVNPIKDAPNAMTAEITEKGFKEGANFAKGYFSSAIADAFGLSKQRDNWLLAGGGSSGLLGAEIKADPEEAIKSLAQKGQFTDRFSDVVTNPVKFMEYVGRSTEESTRLAKFNKDFEKLSPEIKEKLNDPYTPISELPIELRQIALESRAITQDFSKMGTVAQQVNKVIPFFNPALHGTLRLGKLIKENPARFAAAQVILSGIPAALAFANNLQYQDYNDLREYERRGNMIWIWKDRTPEEVEAGKPLHAFKIPLSQLNAPFYNTAEELLKFTQDTEPDATNKFLKSMGGVISSTISNMSPAGDVGSITPIPLKMGIQLKTNTDLYSGMPIEPDYIDTDGDSLGDTPREDVPSSLRKGYYTGPTTELLGKITGPLAGVSPAQLDSMIRTGGAGLGKTIVGLTDTVLGQPPETKSNPILSRFMAPRGGQIAQNERDLETLENKKIQDETFGGNSIFNVLNKNNTDTNSNQEIKINEIKNLPETTKELGFLYEDAGSIINSYEEKKTKIQYGEYDSETKRNKDLKKLETDYQNALNLQNEIENRYPKQVFEIGLDVYGKGSTQGVEKRGDWAVEKLYESKTDEEFQDLVNQMWDAGVLTAKSTGTAAYIKEVYGLDVTKYTGTNKKLKTSTGDSSGGGKKASLSVNVPEYKTPKINLVGNSIGGGISSIAKPIKTQNQTYNKIKVKMPKANLLSLPKSKKISADITPMRTRIRGL